MIDKSVEISRNRLYELFFSEKTGMNLIIGGDYLPDLYFTSLKDRLGHISKKDCLISCSDIFTDEWFIKKLLKPYSYINNYVLSKNFNELTDTLKYYDNKVLFTKPYIPQFTYIMDILRAQSSTCNYFHIDLPFEEFYQEYSDKDYFNDKIVLLFEELLKGGRSLRTCVNVIYKLKPSIKILSSLETEQAKGLKNLFNSIIVLTTKQNEHSILHLGKGKEPITYKIKLHYSI